MPLSFQETVNRRLKRLKVPPSATFTIERRLSTERRYTIAATKENIYFALSKYHSLKGHNVYLRLLVTIEGRFVQLAP